MSDTPKTNEWQRVYVCQKHVEENGLDEATDAALNLMRDLERDLNLRDQELAALKGLIVEELNEAGIWETFDGEELHTGNWIQGLRLLKRKVLNNEKLLDDFISQQAADSERLDWLMKTLALNALPLDEWDRDNIDDAMDREAAE